MPGITPVNVWFMINTMWVKLADGRVLVVPLSWYPRLKEASPEQREEFELSAAGIHWPGINEDLSIAGILAGNRDTRTPEQRARMDKYAEHTRTANQ